MEIIGGKWEKYALELLNAKRMESFKHVREEEVSLMIRSIWEKSKSGTIAVDVSKAISTLTSNIVWRMLARRKFADDDLGGDFKGFKDLLVELITTAGAFNIGDFIPYLDWLDLQGINRRMKKIHKTFDEFAEKIIDDHVAHRMATASNGQKEEEPMLKISSMCCSRWLRPTPKSHGKPSRLLFLYASAAAAIFFYDPHS
jgi:flavonoid 3'-monooxygenase